MLHRKGFILALLCLLFVAFPAVAKIPPMPRAQLEEMADLVLVGVVTNIKESGSTRDDRCYTWQDHVAELKVETITKGDKTVTLIKVAYPTMVKDEKHCAGGQTSYELEPGARYEMVLAAGANGIYRFINWAGLKRIDEPSSPKPTLDEPSSPEPTLDEPSSPEPTKAAPTSEQVPKAPSKKGACACGTAVGSPGQGSQRGWWLLVGAGLLISRRRQHMG